jgi:SulP family sulfate permease
MTSPEPATGKRGIGDIVGGFVAGLYSVPEGIGYASLAGISPMLGIYAGMVPVAVAATATGSVLMMSTLTSAIALTMGHVLEGTDYAGVQVPQAVFTMGLLAGGFMVLLGALKLGRIVDYVSNAVMTGFVMGVAVLILVGKFDSIFGYDPTEFSNKVVKAADILLHPGEWDPTTTVVGVGTIVLAFGLKVVPRLDRYALVLVVVVGTLAVWLLDVDTPLISDEATIPTGLAAVPIPTSLDQLPDLTMVPTLLVGAIAIAIVALAQGAGIRPAFPNPDSSASSASRDFLGQGMGNVAGAFFQSTPTGGSLSRTAVSADGGARHRRAGYVAAATVLLLVVFLGPVVSAIPEAVIGGLLFVIGVELVLGRLPDARLAWHTGRQERSLFLITLVLTMTVPLQWAIIIGAFLSLFAFVSASSSRVELKRAVRDEAGWLWTEDIPDTLPADEPLLLRYTGPNFFAYVTAMGAQLPEAVPGQPGVLVLDVGSLQEFSSTTLKHIEKYRAEVAEVGSGLVLTGIGDDSRSTLVRTELLERLGDRNVLADDPHVGASIEIGWRRGCELLEELRAAAGLA